MARGYEEDSSQFRVDSPTCTRESLRLVISIAAMKSWNLESIDFTAAFLQGGPIQRNVFLRLPSDVCPKSTVWKLKRTIYGLNDAPRSWYEKIRGGLISLGGTISYYDQALFLWHDCEGQLVGIIACHVDDFALCGNTWFQKQVLQKIMKNFKVGDHQSGTFKHLGLMMNQNRNSVKVSQHKYCQEIEPIEIKKHRSCLRDSELTREEKYDLRSLGGQLLWASTQTRPDLSFLACQLANVGRNPTVKQLHEANKAVRKMKNDKVEIKYPKLNGSPHNLKVICFSDASYAALDGGASQGGHIVFLSDGNENVAPILWSSKKLDRITKSPIASETLALCEGADSAYLVASMIQEIFILPQLPKIICYIDNASLFETLKTSRSTSDRRLRVDIARLRDMTEKEEIEVRWVPGCNQIADPLTKNGASSELLLDILKSGKLKAM